MATRHLDYHRDGKWAAQSEPLQTRNMPECKYSMATATAVTSHYVSRLRAEIGSDIHHDFLQAKYNWSGQQWCHIAWNLFEMVAQRTQTKQAAINQSTKKLIHNWLNLSSQRAEFVKDDNDDSNHAKLCPYCQEDKDTNMSILR